MLHSVTYTKNRYKINQLKEQVTMRDYRQLLEDAEQFKKDHDLYYVMVKINKITDEEAQAVADEVGSTVSTASSLSTYAMKYIDAGGVQINFDVNHTPGAKIRELEAELAKLKEKEGVTIG